MNSAAMHSIVARCLVDPAFLRQMRNASLKELAATPVSRAGGLDFEKIYKLLGQIVRVRHAPVMRLLPTTFSLMRHYACEIDFFADYAETYFVLRRKKEPGEVECAVELIDYLVAWLRSSDMDGAEVVCAMALHERAILAIQSGFLLGQEQRRGIGCCAMSDDERILLDDDEYLDLFLWWPRTFWCEVYPFDVIHIKQDLTSTGTISETIDDEPVALGYVLRPEVNSVEILRLGAEASFFAGGCSASTVGDLLIDTLGASTAHRARRGLRVFIEDCINHGFLAVGHRENVAVKGNPRADRIL